MTNSKADPSHSGGLFQLALIRHRVEDAGNSEQPEVPDGALRIRVRQHVEPAHQHEKRDVLKVIQVIAGKKEEKKLWR